MDLNAVMMFNRVVKVGGFSKAAAELGVTKSTISKKIAELESYLGTTLLRRTTRSLQLTDMGKQFHEQSSRGLSEIKKATEQAQATSVEPRGRLRVTAPSDFATSILAPLLAGFLETYPKVSLEMMLTDKVLDLVNDDIDVAIRIGPMMDSSLGAKKVGRDVFQLVASPAYIKRSPSLQEPGDLKKHNCLVFTPKPDMQRWRLKSGASRTTFEPEIKFISNNVTAVKALVVQGAGVALLPVSNCREEIEAKRIKVVMPEWSMEDAPIHFVFQKHLFMPPKVSVFISYMEQKMKPLFI
ncbi:LysR family transcriptional regulator [Cystobacter fuscus]|uniref:LysR family transcriptional regulator n=1 Tax=Cystobacter fuscus TaxID=43 RepID=UPI0005B87B12|nr:LysR family transcriptional regulator [Cystobacter fuscus]